MRPLTGRWRRNLRPPEFPLRVFLTFFFLGGSEKCEKLKNVAGENGSVASENPDSEKMEKIASKKLTIRV